MKPKNRSRNHNPQPLETLHLGSPIARYESEILLDVVGQIILALLLSIVLVGVLIVILPPSVQWIIFLLGVWVASILVLWQLGGYSYFRGLYGTRIPYILIFHDGFSYSFERDTKVFEWSNITEINLVDYVVPTNNRKFVEGTVNQFSFEVHQGTQPPTQLKWRSKLVNVLRVVGLQLAIRSWKQHVERINDGETIHFGVLGLNDNALITPKRIYLFEDVKGVVIKAYRDKLAVKLTPQNQAFAHTIAQLNEVKNPYLLLVLLANFGVQVRLLSGDVLHVPADLPVTTPEP